MQAALRARSIKAALPPMVDLIVAAATGVVMLVFLFAGSVLYLRLVREELA